MSIIDNDGYFSSDQAENSYFLFVPKINVSSLSSVRQNSECVLGLSLLETPKDAVLVKTHHPTCHRATVLP